MLLSVGLSKSIELPAKNSIFSMSEQEKLLLYEKHKINPYKNTLYSLFLPTYGHAKVNKWHRGLIILALQGFAYMLNDADAHPTGPRSDGVKPNEAKKYSQVFVPILLVDTFYQTTIYNKNLYDNIFTDCIVNDDCGDTVITYEEGPDSSTMDSKCDPCKQSCESDQCNNICDLLFYDD